MTAAIVADSASDCLGYCGKVCNQLVRRLFGKRFVTLESSVQVGYVGLVMFAVVDFHRLGVDVRFQGIRGVIK